MGHKVPLQLDPTATLHNRKETKSPAHPLETKTMPPLPVDPYLMAAFGYLCKQCITRFTPNSTPCVCFDMCCDKIRVAAEMSGLSCAVEFRNAMPRRALRNISGSNSLPSRTLATHTFVIGAGAVLHFLLTIFLFNIFNCFGSDSEPIPPILRLTPFACFSSAPPPLVTTCSSSRTPSWSTRRTPPTAPTGPSREIHRHAQARMPGSPSHATRSPCTRPSPSLCGPLQPRTVGRASRHTAFVSRSIFCLFLVNGSYSGDSMCIASACAHTRRRDQRPTPSSSSDPHLLPPCGSTSTRAPEMAPGKYPIFSNPKLLCHKAAPHHSCLNKPPTGPRPIHLHHISPWIFKCILPFRTLVRPAPPPSAGAMLARLSHRFLQLPDLCVPKCPRRNMFCSKDC